jgi:hypothetical protein
MEVNSMDNLRIYKLAYERLLQELTFEKSKPQTELVKNKVIELDNEVIWLDEQIKKLEYEKSLEFWYK